MLRWRARRIACSSQIFARMALRVTMLRRRTAAGGSSGCPVRRCSDARPGFIVSHFERAAIRLRSGPGAPTDDERARECGIGKVDRDGVVKHPAHARWRHRPAIRAAILVQPGGDLSMAAPETLRRYCDPDAHRKSALGGGDHFARVAWHDEFLVRSRRLCDTGPPVLSSHLGVYGRQAIVRSCVDAFAFPQT
jgi:hypothetical protein